MAWHGTVTCSHCYQRGHNKRKCPQLTQELKEQHERQMKRIEYYLTATDEELESRGENREWNKDYHQNRANEARDAYLKRTKIDLASGKKVTNKVAKAVRMKKVTCGYCGVSGHTRRVCQNAKNDYKVFVERTKQVRAEWVEKVRASGLGVGSLVVTQVRGYNAAGEWGDWKMTGLVSTVDWHEVTAHNPDPPAFIVKTSDDMKGVAGHGRRGIRPIRLSEQTNDAYIIVPSGVAPDFPANWTGDVPTIKEIFSTQEERPWAYKWADDKWHQAIRDDLGLPKEAYDS